jgi:hypothetical protein
MVRRTQPSTTPIVVDIETAGLPNAADYLEPVMAAKNLKDPEKIRADIEQRTADRDSKLALDWNVGRIVGVGWWTEEGGIEIRTCPFEIHEAEYLATFWRECRHRTIVGFNVKGFDLPFLIQRSRYLGVKYPMLDLGKYSRRGVIDLFLDLTFNQGTYDAGAMRRTLKAFCRRFGIAVDDETTGADMPRLFEAGEFDAIAAHLRSDVEATVALAQRLGVINEIPARVG